MHGDGKSLYDHALQFCQPKCIHFYCGGGESSEDSSEELDTADVALAFGLAFDEDGQHFGGFALCCLDRPRVQNQP